MINYCKYCGGKTHNIDMCTQCKEKILLIRKIKAMIRPYYNSKKARERLEKEREERNGRNKDLHKH